MSCLIYINSKCYLKCEVANINSRENKFCLEFCHKL